MIHLLSSLLLAVLSPALQETTKSPWIWPLSGDFYAPRELLETHGQPQLLTNSVLLHRGIDIKANWYVVPWGGSVNGPPFGILTKTESETVRSCFDGVVRYVHTGEDESGWSNQVVVSPASDSDWGLRYLHLESVWVSEGEGVFRGEVLGRVAMLPDDLDHVHLDLALEECTAAGGCAKEPLLGNPLPYISSRPDSVPPYFGPIGPLGSASTAPSPSIVFLDSAQDPIEPAPGLSYPTLKGSVDILVRVSDRFSITGTTGPVNVPLRIRVNVRALYFVLVGIPTPVPPQIHLPLAYSNRIEFLDPIADADSASCYRAGMGLFDSTDEDFYVIATNGIASEGAWDTTKSASGVYAVEVTAEDAAGNLSTTDAFVWVKN